MDETKEQETARKFSLIASELAVTGRLSHPYSSACSFSFRFKHCFAELAVAIGPSIYTYMCACTHTQHMHVHENIRVYTQGVRRMPASTRRRFRPEWQQVSL